MKFVFVNFTSVNHPVSNCEMLSRLFHLFIRLFRSLAHLLAHATILWIDDQSVLWFLCGEWSNYRYIQRTTDNENSQNVIKIVINRKH